jgi:tetratricopeptide (TPR) repeat protein
MPEIEIRQALELFSKACSAEEQGKMNLAEVYYLKSAFAFEQAGGKYFMNAANALTALACLRKARGNYDGALCSAKQALRITKQSEMQTSDPDVELIRMEAWVLIEELVHPEDVLH